jgi:NADPH-dependent curcumin reductase CurA
VGQFGKSMGCYVVGSAGSDAKVEYLKSIGFDAAFNYKNGDIQENLEKYCPNGIDVYFEGVGGKMLDAVLAVANNYARIIACGMISQYNLEKPEPIYNSMYIVSKRIKFDGFIILDHIDYEDKFLENVTPLLVNKTIQYKEDIVQGIDKVPEALIDVLRGKNFGKMVVHIADL